MGLGRRWKAHVDRAKEKNWEHAADQGEAGIDLEDIGEHMNDALPDKVAGGRFGPLWFNKVFGWIPTLRG
jgi:hypothetical protein